MREEHKQRDSAPQLIWWLLGVVALCFAILWSYGGIYRTIWWFGLLFGSVAIAVVSLWIRDTVNYGSGFYSLADAVMRLSWIAAALIFLFGILVAGTVLLGPIVSAMTPFVHTLGWIVLVGAVLWLISKYLKEKEEIRYAAEQGEAQMKFEMYLSTEEPDKYRKYERIKDKHDLEENSDGLAVHWHQIAQEAEVPIIEIIKKR